MINADLYTQDNICHLAEGHKKSSNSKKKLGIQIKVFPQNYPNIRFEITIVYQNFH